MRTLETAAVLIYVIYVLILLAPSQRRGRLHAWIGIAAGIVAVAQAAIEGYRWQMLPLDVVIAITAILSLLSLLKRTTSPSPRRFAFRIGQTKNVLVHKFICRGTVEEKIDQLIESKRNLSQELLEGGAGVLLTELKDDELLKLVALDINRALKEE